MRISKRVLICTAFMEINLWCVVCRLTTEVDSEELSWVQSNVDEVITMLQQSPGLPSIPEVCTWFNNVNSSFNVSVSEFNYESNSVIFFST